jgi:hypothetical protein
MVVFISLLPSIRVGRLLWISKVEKRWFEVFKVRSRIRSTSGRLHDTFVPQFHSSRALEPGQSLALVKSFLRQSMALAGVGLLAQRAKPGDRVSIARVSRFVSEEHQKSTLKLRSLIPKSKMNKTKLFLYII